MALALVVVICVVYSFVWANGLMNEAGEAALGGELTASEALFRKLGRHPTYQGEVLEGLAVCGLLRGQLVEAEAQLQLAAQNGVRFAPVPLTPLFEQWLKRGEYGPTDIYVRYLLEGDTGSIELQLWAGYAANGLGRLDEAERLLSQGQLKGAAQTVERGRAHLLGPPFRTADGRARYQQHLASLNNALRDGSRPYWLDRHGEPALVKVIKTGEMRPAELSLLDVLERAALDSGAVALDPSVTATT